MFKAGDKVICTTSITEGQSSYEHPRKGNTYTVCIAEPPQEPDAYQWLGFAEIRTGSIAANWGSSCFRLIELDEMPVIAGPGRRVGDSLFSEDATFTPDETTGGVKGAKACRYDLIPVRPLAEVAAVLGQGAIKYSENNWRKGYDWGKSYAAAMRHMNRFWAGEKVDPDSGLHPLAHAVANLMFLVEFTESHPELDDRGDAPV